MPPVSVSTFETEPVLSKAPRISVSEPEPRSTLSLAPRAEPSVIVSAAEPPTSVSTLETVAVLAKLPSVSLSLPSPRLTDAFDAWVESVIVSAPVPPRSVSTLAIVAVLAAVGKCELVVAGVEVDAFGARQRRAERQGVIARAADQRLDVRDRDVGDRLPLTISLSLPDAEIDRRHQTTAWRRW